MLNFFGKKKEKEVVYGLAGALRSIQKAYLPAAKTTGTPAAPAVTVNADGSLSVQGQ